VLIIVLPNEVSDAPVFVSGHGAVIGFPERANPHIEHTIDRREIPDLCAIRRNLGISAFRIPE
jgi:hypothetical protein